MSDVAVATVQAVMAQFPGEVSARAGAPGEAVVTVEAAAWPKVARWLATAGRFTFFSDLCGVDWPHRTPRFDVVVSLLDMMGPRRLRVVVGVEDGSPPALATVSDVWP